MSVSTNGIHHTYVIYVAHNSHDVVVSRLISVPTLGENRSNVTPVVHKSHKVDTGRVMSVSTHGINHNVMSVMHSCHDKNPTNMIPAFYNSRKMVL